MLLQLEVKLKMQLIALSVDVEQAETWQLHVLDEFYNFTKTISPNFNIFDMVNLFLIYNFVFIFNVTASFFLARL